MMNPGADPCMTNSMTDSCTHPRKREFPQLARIACTLDLYLAWMENGLEDWISQSNVLVGLQSRKRCGVEP